jgi:hypothetical protein
MYPTLVFLSDVNPNIIILQVTHEFSRAGGFYFKKKQLQCMETVTPFIIYYLYAFNDTATICAELTSLLKEARQGMQDNLTLSEEFEYAKTLEINIRQGVPKLPGQPGQHFCDYLREMQEVRWAHLIKCNVNLIPFLQTLIGYMKEQKLAAPIWGGQVHITKTVDWDSPKEDVSCFIRMMQDHMCYNMSVVSIEVRGISDLNASAEILCPTTRNVLGHLSLQQTLTKYLKLQDGTPMCTELHQHGLQGPVDMVIPNTAAAEAGFEMFNKHPAGYLYHMLPTFGASPLFCQDHPLPINGGRFDNRGASVHV